MLVWSANEEVYQLINKVKEKHHHPRLLEANVAASFNDSKPFIGDRFNWGKVTKFSTLAKLWHPENKKYDFQLSICGDVWHSILDANQREALIDLHLTRCQVEYVPEMENVNGKNKPIKDEWGRIQYTNVIKRDDEGCPKWRVLRPDLSIHILNIARYGLWCSDLAEIKKVIDGREPISSNA